MLYLSCGKKENKQKEAGFGPFFKKICVRNILNYNWATAATQQQQQDKTQQETVKGIFKVVCMRFSIFWRRQIASDFRSENWFKKLAEDFLPRETFSK